MTGQFPTAYLNVGDRNDPRPENCIIIVTMEAAYAGLLLDQLEEVDTVEVLEIREALEQTVVQFEAMFPDE